MKNVNMKESRWYASTKKKVPATTVEVEDPILAINDFVTSFELDDASDMLTWVEVETIRYLLNWEVFLLRIWF